MIGIEPDADEGFFRSPENRPGLTGVRYRIGDYNTFKRALLKAASESPALSDWSYRGPDDWGLLLFEMWAYVADIITFYQERIANEAWLSTCKRRESASRLSALVGYRPKPGLSSCVDQAFMLESGKSLKIPAKTRIESKPAPGKRPQIFETVSDLEADWRANCISMRAVSESSALASGHSSAVLKTDGSLLPGETERPLLPGDRLLFFEGVGGGSSGSFRLQEAKIEKVGRADGRQLLEWGPSLTGFSGSIRCSRVLDAAFAFGHDASDTIITPYPDDETVPYRTASYDHLGALKTVDENQWSIDLDGVYDSISKDGRVLLAYDDELHGFIRLLTVTSRALVNASAISVFEVASRSASLFSVVRQKKKKKHVSTRAASGFTQGSSVSMQGVSGALTAEMLAPPGVSEAMVSLPGPAVASGTVTRIVARVGSGAPVMPEEMDSRKVRIYILDDRDLSFWGRKYGDQIKNGEAVIPVGVLEPKARDLEAILRPERPVILQDGGGVCIRASIHQAPQENGDGDLAIKLKWLDDPPDAIRSPALLYANVVRADHGESISSEILGDGDASASSQGFSLKRSPLTYLESSESPSGARSTLEVRVGGEAWQSVGSFYGRGGEERVFAESIDEAGRTVVRFGDGVFGQRPATGKKNIQASYRVGLGRDGNIEALALTTLLDRPAGVKKCMNPIRADGGADPEPLYLVRKNAANRARTFGRIVSLTDYEDAAREHPTVSKARASWVWSDGGRAVLLAVSGPGGEEISGESLSRLVSYIRCLRDPRCRLIIKNCKIIHIALEISVLVRDGQPPEAVRSSVRSALLDLLSFERCEPGEWVRVSDIYACGKSVSGVQSLQITRMGRVGHLSAPQDLEMGYLELSVLDDVDLKLE